MDGLHAIHIVASCIAGLFAGMAFHSRSDVTLIAFTAPPLRLMAVRLLPALLIARVAAFGGTSSGLPSCQGTLLWRPCGLLGGRRESNPRHVYWPVSGHTLPPCLYSGYCRYLIGLSYTFTMQFVVSSLPFTNSQS